MTARSQPSAVGRPMSLKNQLRTSGALVVTLAGCLFAPPAASAAPQWLAPIDLAAADRQVISPNVGVDGQGNVVAAWVRQNSAGEYIVEIGTRPAGGSFSVQQIQTAAGF